MLSTLPTPAEMVAWLDRFVIGQQRAKRDLASAVYGHYITLAAHDEDPVRHANCPQENILMMGPTGCGKTLMVKLLAELLDVPVSFGVATRFSETGYVGDSVESLISNLVERAGGDLERVRRGIVFIDEIDKIARRETRGRDVSGEGVQHGLLTLLEGSLVQVKVDGHDHEIDTSEILFIGTGSFQGIEDVTARRRVRERGSTLGFRTTDTGPESPLARPTLRDVETDDLVAFGFVPEFIGRFAVVTYLEPLGPADLVRILHESEASPLLQQQRLFELHGIDLQISRAALLLLAERALAKGTGARGLPRVLLEQLADLRFRLPELARDGIRRVIIGPSVVRDGNAPRLSSGAVAKPDRGTAVGRVVRLREQAFGVRAAEPAARLSDPRDAQQ
jgi:ATP-dependent Clp protease ATP-binding subunit ClpX